MDMLLQSVSPGAPGTSPTYQRSEPSPDSGAGYRQQPQSQAQPQPQPPPPYQPPSPDGLDALPSDSSGSPLGLGSGLGPGLGPGLGMGEPAMASIPAPTTMMGQLMGALNPSLLDDLNLNIEGGGFDCNVEEVIERELNLEGTLDFNFSQHAQHLQPLQQVGAQGHRAAPRVRVAGRSGIRRPSPSPLASSDYRL